MDLSKIYLVVTKLLKSKTLVVNWAALVAATLTLWTNSEVIAQYPEVVAAMGSVLAGVNIVLRFLTKDSLESK